MTRGGWGDKSSFLFGGKGGGGYLNMFTITYHFIPFFCSKFSPLHLCR